MAAKHAIFALLLSASAPATAGTFAQTNLVSDGSVPAAVTDPNLKNPWGISYAPGGAFWVSDNNSGLSTLYSGSGAIVPLVVTIPAAAGSTALGSPTGQLFNPSKDFLVSAGGKTAPADFIFVTEDGTISGWSPSVSATNAVVAVDRSSKGAVYKGVTMYTDSAGNNYLLVTDFRAGKVDVFDGKFKLVNSFRDHGIPEIYSPYNVAVLNGNIFVTYARVNAKRHDSVSGPGLGGVEEVTFSGQVLVRVLHGPLNAPWGLALAPSTFGTHAGDILVGNFGSGTIATYTLALAPRGLLKSTAGGPVTIYGLWGLIDGNGGSGGDAGTLYFTAGPNDEANGLLGALNYTP